MLPTLENILAIDFTFDAQTELYLSLWLRNIKQLKFAKKFPIVLWRVNKANFKNSLNFMIFFCHEYTLLEWISKQTENVLPSFMVFDLKFLLNSTSYMHSQQRLCMIAIKPYGYYLP